MYNNELEPTKVQLDQLFLDPNNPRFWTEQDVRDVPDAKIPDPKIQEQAQKRVEAYGIEELYHNILRNGFLPLDRIVVRPIQGHGGKYVAVEGNRRLLAVKLLYQRISEGVVNEEGIDEDYLNKLKDSIKSIEVLVYKGENPEDISWILQGIRHISGIRDWQPAQRARLIAKQIEQGENGNRMTYSQAGQKFGLSAMAVGRLYRAYKGLQQMRADDDYGPKAKNEYFSLYEEAYRNRKVREWLGWDDTAFTFKNTDQVKQFYGWISPDAENDEKRRIHDPKQVQKVALLLEKGREDLIGQLDRHEITIDVAADRAMETPGAYNWQKELEKVKATVAGLPIVKIINEDQEGLKASLIALRDVIDKSLKIIDSVSS